MASLPNTCPICGHPVTQYDRVAAICLGSYDHRLGRKTGCGAEWALKAEEWYMGYTVDGVWYDGPSPDIDRDWKKELATPPPPAHDIPAMITEGRKLYRAKIKRRIDEGIATRDQLQWWERKDKPKRRDPQIKHTSQIGVAGLVDPFS